MDSEIYELGFDYFEDLARRIADIRTSERRFYKLMNFKCPKWERTREKLEMRLS